MRLCAVLPPPIEEGRDRADPPAPSMAAAAAAVRRRCEDVSVFFVVVPIAQDRRDCRVEPSFLFLFSVASVVPMDLRRRAVLRLDDEGGEGVLRMGCGLRPSKADVRRRDLLLLMLRLLLSCCRTISISNSTETGDLRPKLEGEPKGEDECIVTMSFVCAIKHAALCLQFIQRL